MRDSFKCSRDYFNSV